MVIQIYVPPEPEMELRELKMGDINDAISLEYELFFCGVGTFTLELPLTTPFAEQLLENNLLYLREDDVCFIIKNVKRTNDKITVVGYDLNGMLLDRLTMERDSGVEGTEGKDCISGTTETCVKHFVDYNMVNSADTFRNYARFAIAEDLGRGNAEDSDLVGKEIVEDVVRTLCEGAELGYRVKLQLHDSETEPLLIFDVYEREDHTADQSERNRVIFSEGLQNITEIERETGITANKNALWCDTGGENVFVYTTLKNGDVFNPVGWDRREEYISLSVTDNYDTAEIELAARKQMADKFAATDSLVIDAGNPLDYGTIYKLGDIVTVYDKKRSLQLNSVISSVLVKRSGAEHSVQISLGERKPKLLDKYAKQSQIQRKEQTDFPPTAGSGASGTGTLNSYEYTSDNSVNYNGVIYTVERDEATGLINKITDSNGNEFEPSITGTITDVTLHNAVLWALAMHGGLGTYNYFNTLWDYNQSLDLTGYPISIIGVWEKKKSGYLYRASNLASIYLAIDKGNISRGNYGIRAVYKGNIRKYEGEYPNPPIYSGAFSGIWTRYITGRNYELYISQEAEATHPALAARFLYGKRFVFTNDIKFREMFDLQRTDITGAMLYKWNDSYFVNCFTGGDKPILDITNARLDRGTNALSCNIASYMQPDNVYDGKYALQDVVPLTLEPPTQYGTSYFDTLINDLEGNVFFNTFDLCDENGNILLAANCDISEFI